MNPRSIFAVIAGLLASLPLTGHGQATSQAKVSEVVREVSLLKPEAAPAPAALGDVVSGSTAVRTGTQSRSELTFPDDTLLRLGSSTQFSFLRGKHEFNLSRGTALLKTSKRTGGARIHSGGVTAAISGSLAIYHTPPLGQAGIGKLLLFYGKASLNLCGKKYPLKPWQMCVYYVDEQGNPDCKSVRVFYFNAETTARTSKLIDFDDPQTRQELEGGKKDFLADNEFPARPGGDNRGSFPVPQENNTVLGNLPQPEPVIVPPLEPVTPMVQAVSRPTPTPRPPEPMCPPGQAYDEDFMRCFPIKPPIDSQDSR